jgi:ankyrin repeat protein
MGSVEMDKLDSALWELFGSIVKGDATGVSRKLVASPGLAHSHIQGGATRQESYRFFLDRINRYVYTGDTALHIAAAAYETEIARMLLAAGADVHARNRRGQQPLHSASVGGPGSPRWNPSSQSAMIVLLIEAGADPNVMDKSGVSPLHKAIRTRCAEAVRTLLARGADPALKNMSGSTPMVLATHNTGRGGSGSPEAKAQQQEILRLLGQLAQATSNSK